MIPIRLSLHNFMCYREAVPPIEFASIRMACLTGENGAGKSALLDAITWVLWGKARSNADAELMSLGANEMRVEFQFVVNEVEYRVARRVRRGSVTRAGGKTSPTTWLELYARAGDDSWHGQSGDSVRETQTRIVDVLRMEYETFINSAFLVQGRSDEFTTKTPGQRKEVLAKILDLSVYDTLEHAARERHRMHTDSLRELNGELARQRAVAELESEYAAAEFRLNGEIASFAASLEALANDHAHLQACLRELDQIDEQRRVIEARIEADATMQRQLEHWTATTTRDVAVLEALVARREAIEAGADALAAVQQERTTLDGAFKTLQALEGQRQLADSAIEAARRELQRDQRELTRQIGELDKVARTKPALEARRAELSQSAGEATRLMGEIATLQAQERQLHGETEMLRGENTLLMVQMKRLAERRDQIDAADAACPVCRRPLGSGEREHIHDDYQRDGLQLKTNYLANQERMAELVAMSKRIEAQIAEAGHRRDAAELEARQEARTSEQLTQARRASADLAVMQVKLVETTERLDRAAFAVPERDTLAHVVGDIAALAYDAHRHEQVRAEERRLGPFAEQRVSVREAVERLPRQRQQLDESLAAVEEVKARLTGHRVELATLLAQVADLSVLRNQEVEARNQLDQARRQRAEMEREIGRLQALLAASRLARAASIRLEDEQRLLVDERERFAELIEAFGKKGIQAMVIETVVPELQDEANALLDRMPGNSMRLELQTQKNKQNGDAIETLDVVIKDEIGARRYELYSGGEAFRVNFALRVALSKVLTRRAGAQLQTLIIDEGFGTQDERGREGLIEAIRSIEEDFATILVISHMPDIKDEFGTRIEVTKGIDGSRVMVV